MNSLSFSYIPQKVIEKNPVYSNICTNCGSNNTFPLWNMVGATRHCNLCNNKFTPLILKYEERIVEKKH